MAIQQLKSLKVLVIGDYCIDVFKYGKCTRLSPEAPVPVFLYDHEIRTDGMAGNVYNNIKSLKIDATLLVSSKEIIKERFIDLKSKQHLLRTDYEKQIPELTSELVKLEKYDAIVIADYNKGSITKNVFQKIIENYEGPIFIDSKKEDLTIYSHKNSIIKINQQEFQKARIPSDTHIIVTLGSDGAMKDGIIYPTKQVEVFDVSGAGDSFMAGLVAQYLLTKNFNDAINFANICASNVVKKTGTAIIDFDEVKNDLCF
jgi:D-beta-D-heptose 7-phosphate kinase/D-beta-D-heptose 1-phosphate adenosyltransferase